MSVTFTHTETYIVETCCSCGINFGVPNDFYEWARDHSDKWFYCPNGHRQHYGDSKSDRLQRELDSANSRSTGLSHRLDHANRSRAALRGQVTKIKRRISKGICPCCRRNFANLKQHMEGQHPNWREE